MSFQDGEKSTPFQVPVGVVDGAEYLVQNQEDKAHGYADTYGVLLCATAIASPDGENATPFPRPPGSVAGFAYLVQNPGDQGYTFTYGDEKCPTATTTGMAVLF
jgi:hypothetical protein